MESAAATLCNLALHEEFRDAINRHGVPCLTKTIIMPFVHGDDFVVSGPESHLLELKKAIGQKYKAKVRAVLGPNENDDKSVIILGRVAEWISHGIDLSKEISL